MKDQKIVISTLIFIWISFYIYPAMIANYSNIGFLPDQSDSGEKTGTIKTVERLVVEGAGAFLDSHADIILFMNRIELAELKGIDYGELQTLLTNAIEKMEKSNATYLELKKLAAELPYNPHIINKLETFDYDVFLKKRSLNNEIFNEVSELLGRGDVRGVYKRLHKDTADILKYLSSIKTSIDSGVLPELPVLWRTNERYMATILFGQICTEVFYNCK